MFNKYQLLECLLNIMSQQVGVSNAQQAQIIGAVSPVRKGQLFQYLLPSVGTLSKKDNKLANIKAGEGLLKMVKELKWKLHEILHESKRKLEYLFSDLQEWAWNRINKLAKGIRANKLFKIRSTNKDKTKLLDNLISKDKMEIKTKQQELMRVIAFFTALKEQN